MQTITPFLWFEDQAEEAARFYVSVFRDGKIGTIARYGEAGAKMSGRPAGSVMTVDFEIRGQRFTALNGGPFASFSPATSFVVNCETQEEIDEIWDKLAAGGKEEQCGWLNDKYGVTWQIVPSMIAGWFDGSNPAAEERVMTAMYPMVKLDLAKLQKAYEGDNCSAD